MTEENNVSSNLEVQFAQRLASNEKKIRDRAVKKLRQFLTLRSMKTDGGFQRDEMLKIWKGLFYCMWMSDKPLVQEELARTIAELMIEVKNIKTAMLFYETSLTTLMREWKGIDRLRMDKFYLLARCVLKRGFEFLKLQEWDSELIDWILSILKSGPINHTGPVTGMHYHICDIYLEELSKVGHDCLTSEQVAKFLDPYCILFSKTRNQYLANRIRENIFQELIETSNVALETLKQQGESLLIGIRQNSIDTESTSTLRVDYGGLADRLFNLVSAKDTLSKNRKKTYGVVKQFRELAEGRLPMDNIPDLEESSDDELKKEEDRLVEKLCAENSEETRKKQKRLRGKKRKKELLRAMKMSENIEDDDMNPEHFEDTEIPHDNGDLSNKITSEQDIQDKVAGGESTDSKRQKKEVNMIIMGSNLIAEDKNDMEYSPADESFENWHEKKIKHTAPSKKIRTHDSAPHTATKKRKASNIPDLLQDVPVCKMSRKVAKRKSELLRKRHLLNELMTSERQQESTKKDGKQKPKKTFKEELSLQDTNNNFINDLINNKCNTRKLGIMNEFMTINSIDTPAKTATFFKVAASKVEKLQEKKHQIAVKKKVTQVEPHTPKRVCFEMSKTMVQPFRKNEKSKAVSQSPNCIVFDPRKKPDFGLLKTRTMQTPENSKKRATADDFF